MKGLSRRNLIKNSFVSGLLSSVPSFSFAERTFKHLMRIEFNGPAINVIVSQSDAIELAWRHEFGAVTPQWEFLTGISNSDLTQVLKKMESRGLVFGAAELPIDFRQDESHFSKSMISLPAIANALQRAGVTRVRTWLSPSHPQLTYLANFRLHVERLRMIAKVLSNHGLRLGVEYVGPKTAWTKYRYPFIHTLEEAAELISEVGNDSIGFVLDSWHWYHARESVNDILSLTNQDVVAADINDAPAGVPIDEQIDRSRELPTTTGVINLSGFLHSLRSINYDGPVRAEPFNSELKSLPAEIAVAKTSEAMHRAFKLIE